MTDLEQLIEKLRNPDYGAAWKDNVALMREAAERLAYFAGELDYNRSASGFPPREAMK